MPITGILSQVIVFHDQRNRLKIGNLIVAESNRIRIDAANRNTVRECHLQSKQRKKRQMSGMKSYSRRTRKNKHENKVRKEERKKNEQHKKILFNHVK